MRKTGLVSCEMPVRQQDRHLEGCRGVLVRLVELVTLCTNSVKLLHVAG